MFACEPVNSVDLGFGDVARKDACCAGALPVHVEHDLGGLDEGFGEDLPEDKDHEIHCRVVVVEEHHPVEGWKFCLLPGLFPDAVLNPLLLHVLL